MLARRPLIASAQGATAEIISHGFDGVLIPPGNPVILASAILGLLENPSTTVVLLNEAYRTATTRFTLRAFLDGADAVADEVLQASPARKTSMPAPRLIGEPPTEVVGS